MNRLTILLILLIIVAGCRKDKGPKATPVEPTEGTSSNVILPVNDVQWKVHFQGSYFGNPSGGEYYDTSFHSYTEARSTGDRTVVAGYDYYVFDLRLTSYKAGAPYVSYTGELYLREDSSTRTIYSNSHIANGYSRDVPLWDQSTHVGDTVFPGSFFQEGFNVFGGVVTEKDSLLLGGRYFTIYRAFFPRLNKTVFYSGDGIGLQSGLIPFGTSLGNGGQIRRMDFKYKNDSVYFEYDLFHY